MKGAKYPTNGKLMALSEKRMAFTRRSLANVIEQVLGGDIATEFLPLMV